MAKPLNSSLTAMDWLPQLSVGGAMSDNPNAEIDASKYPSAQRVSCGQFDASAVFDASTCKFGNKKPPYSYANLITFAINATPKGKMTLSEIYDWISEHFPFYNPASNGWKVNIFFSTYKSYLLSEGQQIKCAVFNCSFNICTCKFMANFSVSKVVSILS